MEFTKEQLIEHINGRKEFADECAADSTLHPERREYYELTAEALRIALASLEAEPVACPKCNGTGMADSGGVHPWGEPIRVPCDCTAQPALAVDADDNFYSWFGREWHEHYQQNQYTTAAKQMLGVMAESAWKAGRRAAMLQGAEPVTTAYKLPELTDSQCLEFLAVAFRHARIKGDIEFDDIRLGLKLALEAAPQQEVK